MKISIITPVYNAVNTIEKTILSVLNQKLESELEYIIIDGGSNDGTLDIINRYSDRINILISEKDNGVYDAMNKGVSLATGDVIGIINADDWYSHSALEIVETVLNKNPNISVVYSPIDNYINGKFINKFSPGGLDNLVFKFVLNHPSCFVKKSVYNKVGLFNINYSIAADYDFIFRVYSSGATFHYIPESLASYSLNGMSANLNNRLKLLAESKKVAYPFVKNHSSSLALKHSLFYIKWFLRELITLPIKLIDPYIVIKLKAILRNRTGKLSTNQFGNW